MASDDKRGGPKQPERGAGNDGYDAQDDLSKSIELGFRVIRERMANGGPGWQTG
jgi:hypothetical protein